jgi:hypothetical protein
MAKKKSEFKGTYINALKLYKDINKHKGTEKAVDIICDASMWLILVLGWFISKNVNNFKMMEELDERKESMCNDDYLQMCEHLKVSHTLSEVCCMVCLNEEFDYTNDVDSDNEPVPIGNRMRTQN